MSRSETCFAVRLRWRRGCLVRVLNASSPTQTVEVETGACLGQTYGCKLRAAVSEATWNGPRADLLRWRGGRPFLRWLPLPFIFPPRSDRPHFPAALPPQSISAAARSILHSPPPSLPSSPANYSNPTFCRRPPVPTLRHRRFRHHRPPPPTSAWRAMGREGGRGWNARASGRRRMVEDGGRQVEGKCSYIFHAFCALWHVRRGSSALTKEGLLCSHIILMKVWMLSAGMRRHWVLALTPLSLSQALSSKTLRNDFRSARR